jgi:hypothetical protein
MKTIFLRALEANDKAAAARLRWFATRFQELSNVASGGIS